MKKGFTLVEVLIVVIIIAILAALILPRMTSQAARAKGAEALQTIGAIKRSVERIYDLTGSFPQASINSIPGAPSYMGTWESIGLQGLQFSKDWKYEYGSSQSNEFYTLAAGPAGSITYRFKDGTGIWTCQGPNLKPREPIIPETTSASLSGCVPS